MSCSALDRTETIETQIDIFDSMRLSGQRAFLLKRAGQTEKYGEVIELTSGWFVLFDKDFRNIARLMYATLDENFRDIIAQGSYFAFGSGTTLDVYSFSNADPIPPDANSPNWRIDGERQSKERFNAPPVGP